jgi:hypothetical protein
MMELAHNMYDGCAVRDLDGRSGRVVKTTESTVEIGWTATGTCLPQVEKISRKDERLQRAVEVLTLDRGWCPMSEVVGLRESAGKFGGLLDELKTLLPETKGFRYPFKRKSSIGLGPRKGRNTARKSEPWECSCKPYGCTCVSGKGRTKRVRKVKINKSWKKQYNKEYKAWASKKNKSGKKAKKGTLKRRGKK